MTTESTILASIRKSKGQDFSATYTISFLLFILVMFSIATLPSLHTLSFIAGWYNEKRLILIIILVATVAVFVFSRGFQNYATNMTASLSKVEQLLMALFVTLGITSSITSTIPAWAFTELGNLILLGLLSLFVSYSIRNNTCAEKIIVISFCVSAALYFIAFLASLLAGLSNGIIDYQSLFSGFINRRFFNQFQSISFPILLLAPFFFNSNKKWYFLLGLIAAFWFMLMLVSDGRGVLLASLLGIIFSSILIPHSRAKWIAHSIAIMVCGILLYLGFDFLLSYNEVISGEVLRSASGGRFVIWLQLLDTIKENPLLGIGPMHYAITPHPFTIAHPHNITLQLIGEFGIPAAFSLIFVITAISLRWAKQQRKLSGKNKSLIPTALTASFIAAIIHGHLSGVFVMPLSQLSFVVICGWMISTSSKSLATKPYEVQSTSRRCLLILLLILSLGAILNGSYPHIQSLINNKPLKAVNPDIDYPAANASRYWSGTYR